MKTLIRPLLKEQSDLGLHCLPTLICPKTKGHYGTLFSSLSVLHFNKIPLYGTFILTIVPAIIAVFIVRYIVVPWQRKKITGKHFHKAYRTFFSHGYSFFVALPRSVCHKAVQISEEEIKCIFEPRHEKTGFLHMRKQRRRSATR